MSSQVPESEALKIKYKEIAALKKAIQEKQELKKATTTECFQDSETGI